jgi:serine/threonine protein phosphatase 1
MKYNRTLVVGDIHGGYKALLQCLERSEFDKENDLLISLGDIADGWSEVPECIEELLTIKNLITIKGNHDDWAHHWLKSGEASRAWLNQGGKATFDAYTIHHPNLMIKHEKEFFDKQLSYYIDDDNRGFVHGGFTSSKGLGHEPHESNYFWDRDLWTLAVLSHKRIHEGGNHQSRRFDKHKEIYLGHTPTIMWDVKPTYREYNDINQSKNGNITIPMNRSNIWNLDTGGGFGGKVTIIDIDTKEYFQSDFVKDLYPDEKGR